MPGAIQCRGWRRSGTLRSVPARVQGGGVGGPGAAPRHFLFFVICGPPETGPSTSRTYGKTGVQHMGGLNACFVGQPEVVGF